MSPRPASQDLTPRQRRVLETFRGLAGRLGRSPSVRELAADLDLAVSDAWRRLRVLVRKGFLEARDGEVRLPGLAMTPVPILGRAPAGTPREPLAVPDGYVAAPAAWGKHRDLFALKVLGDSMEGAGILDGDIVICSRTETARDGEVVVALIEGESTIKRLGRVGGHPALLPANVKYRPIPLNADSRVTARVVGVIRAMG